MNIVDKAQELVDFYMENIIHSRKQLHADAHLKNDLGFDSLDQLDFIMYIEEELDIDLADDHFKDDETYGKLLDSVVNIISEVHGL